jgi:outer membrane protein assembly factor BamB
VVKTDRGELTCFRLQDGEVVWRERVEVESGLLFRNIDMLVVRDSLLTKGDRLEIRALSDGSLLHTIDELSGALDFIMAVDNLDILVGSIGSEENSDELICLALSHFLALVPAD